VKEAQGRESFLASLYQEISAKPRLGGQAVILGQTDAIII
jgi:hypothetical protein